MFRTSQILVGDKKCRFLLTIIDNEDSNLDFEELDEFVLNAIQEMKDNGHDFVEIFMSDDKGNTFSNIQSLCDTMERLERVKVFASFNPPYVDIEKYRFN